MTAVPRRALIAASGAAAALAALPAAAVAPPAGRQVPGLFRLKVGEIEVTSVSDGTIALPWRTAL